MGYAYKRPNLHFALTCRNEDGFGEGDVADQTQIQHFTIRYQTPLSWFVVLAINGDGVGTVRYDRLQFLDVTIDLEEKEVVNGSTGGAFGVPFLVGGNAGQCGNEMLRLIIIQIVAYLLLLSVKRLDGYPKRLVVNRLDRGVVYSSIIR